VALQPQAGTCHLNQPGIDNIGETPQSLKFGTSQDMQSLNVSQHSTGAAQLLEHKAVNLVVTVA